MANYHLHQAAAHRDTTPTAPDRFGRSIPNGIFQLNEESTTDLPGPPPTQASSQPHSSSSSEATCKICLAMPADHLLGIPFVVFMVRFRLGRVFVAPLPSSGSMGGDQSATFPFHNGDDNPTTVTLLLRCFPKCYYKSHRHLTCLRVAPSIRYSIFYSASRRIRMGIRMTPLERLLYNHT